jgi:anti-sigma B factor antagonist
MRTSGDLPRQEVSPIMPFDRSELEPFRCEVAPHRDEVVVRPVGELDLATVPLVDEQLAELSSSGFTRLVLDLRGVRFLDSTGIRMLVAWHGRSTNDGVAFSVIPGPPVVQRVLEITGVDGRLTYASENNRRA